MATVSDQRTIDNLLDTFEGKFGVIKGDNRPRYESFVNQLNPDHFVNDG